MADKNFQRAQEATKAFFASQAATGTASEETERWRDVCDDLYRMLDAEGQKTIRKLERRLKARYAKKTEG